MKKLLAVLSILALSILIAVPVFADTDADAPNWAMRVIIAIVVGAVIALVVVMIMRGQHKSVVRATQANNYIVDNSFKLTNQNDTYLYTTVTSRPLPQQNNQNNQHK